VYWGGQSGGDLYCIGSDNRLGDMRFICRACNATLGVNRLLAESTENQSNQAGYPLIKLSAINRRDLDDKTLYCEAQVKRTTGATGTMGVDGPTMAAQVQMHVSYMDRPRILDAVSRRPPVYAPDTGNRFLVACNRQSNGQCSASGGKQLYCEIRANPQPAEIQWTGAGGQVIATGATYTVPPSAVSDSVQCRALRPGTRDTQDYRMSDAVKVIPYDRPMTKPDNFQTVVSSPPFEGNGQIVRGSGKTFRLTCAAQATPKPRMFWRKRMPSGQQLVANATCENGVHGMTIGEITPQQNMLNGQSAQWVIQSECTVVVDSYAKAGEYFCVACVEVGENEWDCGEDQSLDSPGANPMAVVDVVGPPEFYRQRPQILAADGGTRITVDYCADPAPLPTDDGIEWLIDDERVRPGESEQQYKAAMPMRNMTSNYTDCYTLALSISPITEYDKSRNYRVRVTNTYTSVEMPFNLDDLLSGNRVGEASLSGWWIALIVLSCLGLLVCVVTVAFCFMRQMFCFAPSESLFFKMLQKFSKPKK